MTKAETTPASTTAAPGRPALPIAPVRRAPSGLRSDVRATYIVCHREAIRWFKDRRRLVAGLIQPLLWLFVLGTGLSQIVSSGSQGLDFRTFLFPGILATTVMFTAVFAGVSVVWDREFGFLREMLVAPIRRSSILAGKCLGGAVVATSQAIVVLALAGLCGVPYSPVLMLELVAILFLTSTVLTAIGLMIGAKVANVQSVMPIMQAVITPMMFLSGALYPTAGLPSWLSIGTKLNPVTYAVHPMRHAVFSHLDLPPSVAAIVDTPLTWNGWPVPVALQIGLLAVIGLLVFAIGVRRFSQVD